MKETILQWLSPIIENQAVKTLIAHPFLAGLLAGIVLFWLLRFFWWLLVRKRSCAGIIVKESAGQISVSVAAITGVIKHAVREINSLEIIRVRVAKRGKMYDFDLRVRMDAANGTAPKLMETLSVIVREQMKSAFGIENIGKIKLTILNCDNSSPELPESEDISNAETERKAPDHTVKLNVRTDAEKE